MSRVHDLLDEFSEQNLLLQMLLGVLSETERVERLLPTPAVDVVTPPAPQTVDRFIAALLGIVSLRLQLQHVASEESADRTERDNGARLPALDASSSDERRQPPTIRELMR